MSKVIKSIICIMAVCTLFLVGCSNDSNKNNKVDDKENEISSLKENNEASENKIEDSSEQTENIDNEVSKKSEVDNSKQTENIDMNEVVEKVKNYIINGQNDKPEALKLKWSEAFLNNVNIESLANEYVAQGGSLDNIEELADYITLNAPIMANWEELFKKDLYDKYGKEVTKIEFLEGDLYEAYVNEDGSEVPYVVVSARTGYFHG